MMLSFKKSVFAALFALAALPAVAGEPVALPSSPIEAPKVEAPINPVTEVMPNGDAGDVKEEGKLEEKKEEVKEEIKHELPK